MSAKPEAQTATDSEIEISLYQATKKIYPRSVFGLFAKWRWALVWLTQIVFYGIPWLQWNNRQAVLFDLEARRFYLFDLVLYPQDFIYLTGLLVISALSLFLFTAVAGRLWCGYACPQTVYTEIFLWIEKKIEGERAARIRLDDADFSVLKLGKKSAKHGAWLLFAFWTGVTFSGYFTPIAALVGDMVALNLGPWQTFWVLFYGFATYGNAGFMREQVCKYMCPYARFQSAMFDKDTLIVTYDEARGEPRGPRSKKADLAASNLGSCVDCTLCVQVCPTGIDIRKGLQYECMGCGACIDVCDEVMDKMGYAKGLIKYSTENAMKNNWSREQIWKRVLRARVLIYTAILLGITVAVFVSLVTRTPMKVDVIRDRGTLARVVGQGNIENVFRLNIMNATEQKHDFEVKVQGIDGIRIDSETHLELLPTEVRSLVVRVQVPYGVLKDDKHDVEFVIQSRDNPDLKVSEKSVFLAPRH